MGFKHTAECGRCPTTKAFDTLALPNGWQHWFEGTNTWGQHFVPPDFLLLLCPACAQALAEWAATKVDEEKGATNGD